MNSRTIKTVSKYYVKMKTVLLACKTSIVMAAVVYSTNVIDVVLSVAIQISIWFQIN